MDEFEEIFEQPKDKSFVLTVVGRRGSGKTTLLMQILCRMGLLEVYDKVYIFSPNWRFDPSYKAYMSIAKRKDGQTLEVYETYSSETIDNIFEGAKPESEEKILIIIDDCISEKGFKKVGSSDAQARLSNAGRNRKISLIVVSQNCNSIHADVRRNSSFIVCFKCDNRNEQIALYNSYGWGKPNEWIEWLQKQTTEKHSCIVLSQEAHDRLEFAKIIKLK